MTIDIGGAMRRKPADYGPLADLVSGMRDSITEEVSRGIVETVTSAITSALAGGITVEAPNVSVAPPAVSVTPNIRVDIPADDDAGEITAINRQTVVLEKLSTQLAALYALLSQTVTRHVIRDSNGFITEVTEQR